MIQRLRIKIQLALIPLTLIFIALSSAEQNLAQPFELSNQCPRGFELTGDNRCLLRSLYQLYDSTQNKGVGGTHTGLPSFRDGFSPQQIDLGRYLFFDPILSVDQTVACASCHLPDKGFTDGRAVSVGVGGALSNRSAPSLWNMAFAQRLFWDARATSLEQQAQGPLFSALEMANTPEQLEQRLIASPEYQSLFRAAFADQPTFKLDQLYTALAAFQTSLISLNSRYDQYAHGNHAALSEKEIAGLNVFRSFVARCAECHTPPLFTNNQVAVIGTPEPQGKPFDVGALTTFNDEKMRGAFKVPSLRNIAKTGPYMHSGVFETLQEAAEFYSKGRGHAVPKGLNLHLHWHIWEPDLKEHEFELIAAFLASLTDESLMPEIPARLPSGLTPVTTQGIVFTE